MILNDLIKRVNYYSGDIFTQENIVDYINEGIDRFRHIPQLEKMVALKNGEDVPILLPEQYHFLLAIYSCAMCFLQDENEYGYTQHMANFSAQYEELKQGIASGAIIIKDSSGNQIIDENATEYVNNIYHARYVEEG